MQRWLDTGRKILTCKRLIGWGGKGRGSGLHFTYIRKSAETAFSPVLSTDRLHICHSFNGSPVNIGYRNHLQPILHYIHRLRPRHWWNPICRSKPSPYVFIRNCVEEQILRPDLVWIEARGWCFIQPKSNLGVHIWNSYRITYSKL